MTRQLQATFRNGRLIAAYLRLRQERDQPVIRTSRESDGMLIDYGAAGVPIGIEFVAPSRISLTAVNELLRSVGEPEASMDELWPLISRSRDGAGAAGTS